MNRSLKQKIPAGVKDILPQEAMYKRVLENNIYKIFNGWGYQEVITPVFEYYQALSVGRGGEEVDKIYKFIDRQGHILALRPDMTTPIARLVSTRMREWELPLRLFYMANVFSFEDPQAGRQREFYQAGVELIGDASPNADAEAIAIAVEALKASGLKKFKISIGHVDLLYGMTEELKLDQDQTRLIKEEVSNKNYVGLQELLVKFDISAGAQETFMKIITMRGNQNIISRASEIVNNPKSLKGLKDLRAVYENLKAYNVTDYVEIDLGVLRGLDYYTGIVFEGYSAYLGYPILGGGRYDNLMGQFDFQAPATGFALGLERLILALQKEGRLNDASLGPDYVILYRNERACEAFGKASALRESGQVVITSCIDGDDKDGSEDIAKPGHGASILKFL